MATYAELLTAAKSLMATMLADPLASGSIGGREFTRHNLTTLQDVIDKLQAAVSKEAAAARGYASVVRFQEPK